MSNRYKGAVISATPPTTTGGESGTASGAWTLEQQMQLQAAGLWPAQPTGPYIEQVFSTYLYTGNAGTQTVTNGIDLSTKGGMVWTKSRSNAYAHSIMDTVRGFNYSGTQTRRLDPSTTGGEADEAGNATQATPLSDGFSITTSGGGAINFYNASGATYASWTFREQPKFFDIVTWTGDGTAPRTINHNLGSTPGCIIVKRVSGGFGEDWHVFHRSLTAGQNLVLNSTAASASGSIGSPTSTTFTISSASSGNSSGYPYVAYLFAHDAGGFGLTGTDNVISCGSFTTSGSGKMSAPVNLGYEPQWLMVKNSGASENWVIYDTMRGMSNTDYAALNPNTSGAEFTGTSAIAPNATGFDTPNASGPFANSSTYIYVAIRRGPMRVPTSGASVFNTRLRTGTAAATTISGVGFPTDLVFSKTRTPSGNNPSGVDFDRLRGIKQLLTIEAAAAEYTKDPPMSAFTQDGYAFVAGDNDPNINGYTYCDWNFGRAPGYFDVVCYTGTGSNLTVNHNLGVAPEIIIIKKRVAIGSSLNWYCGWNMNASTYMEALLNTSDAGTLYNYPNWFTSAPTSTTFALAGGGNVNSSGATAVAYLFATCPGVSKVGTYTGTGAAQTINCGFTTGARFVLIKRTDSTGGWHVWDSTRGIIPSNDPYLVLNTSAAEVTGTDYVDTTNIGFDITSTAPAAINANGGTYIFLAIA